MPSKTELCYTQDRLHSAAAAIHVEKRSNPQNFSMFFPQLRTATHSGASCRAPMPRFCTPQQALEVVWFAT